MSNPTLQFYLHTHWDREWYWNFNAYRSELISVVRAVIKALDSGEIETFMLDGQTSLIEDTLAVAPELAAPIKRLAQAGKLSIGPWYVLADQMLVSGESLVRNLAIGIKDATAIGAVDRVGYCPDTFGHTVDLPRILRGFAIDNAILWRGVPALSGGPLFSWQSPDGSDVLTLQLNRGYYQTAFHEDHSDFVMQRYLLGFMGQAPDGKEGEPIKKLKPSICPSSMVDIAGSALIPVGGDHLLPPKGFTERLKSLSRELGKVLGQSVPLTVEQLSLATVMSRLAKIVKEQSEPLQLIKDELRDNRAAFVNERAYMLDGVLSTRLYLKRDNRLAEHRMVRQLEPFFTWLAASGRHPYPLSEMLYSWRLLLQNQPHDSICGCSIDEVHREMLTRTASLNAGLTILERQGIESLSATPAPHGLGNMLLLDPDSKPGQIGVFNSASRDLSQPVAVRIATIAADGQADIGTAGQLLTHPQFQVSRTETIREAFNTLGGVPAFKYVQITDGYYYAERARSLTLSHYPFEPVVEPRSESKSEVVGAAKDLEIDVDVDVDIDIDVAVDAGIDEAMQEASALGRDKQDSTDAQLVDLAHLPHGLQLSNQFFKVYLQQNGDLTVDTKERQYRLGHHLLDVADAGDTYNFDPLPGDMPIKATVDGVRAGESGPFVASLLVDYLIDIPLNLELLAFEPRLDGEPDDSPQVLMYKRNQSCNNTHKITVEITLKKGVPIVFFDTRWHNWSQDHRLEVVFNTFASIDSTVSENHYSLIGRPLLQEPDATTIVPLGHEASPVKMPCQRFFYGGEEIYFNSGLPEYSATKNTVSYTILRAVSKLSQDRLRWRGGGAGPSIDCPEANCLQPLHVSYGWAPLTAASWIDESLTAPESSAYALAEIYEGPLKAFLLPGDVTAGSKESVPLIAWDNPDIQLSALYMDEPGVMLLRLLNISSRAHKVDCKLAFSAASATLVTLEQSHLRDLSVTAPPSLAPWLGMVAAIPVLAYQLVTIKIVLKG